MSKPFDEDAFLKKLEKMLDEKLEEHSINATKKWVKSKQAMSLLGITSKTTLQKFRDEGKIIFRQILPKVILYDRFSIERFLDNKASDKF